MRSLGLCLLFTLLTGSAWAQSNEARGRIFRIDPFQGDGVRVFASFLDASGGPILLGDHILRLSLIGRKIDRDGKTWEEFEDESPSRTEDSVVQTLGNSDVPLDVILVVGAHEDSTREQGLNDALRESASLLLKKIPKSARVNILWVTDESRVFIQSKDLGARVIDYWQPATRQFCSVADERYYDARVDDGAEAEHPCGLVSESGPIVAAIKNSADTYVEGSYPRLFALPQELCKAPEIEHPLKQKLEGDAISRKAYNRQMSTGALDIALQMMAAYARPGSMRVILYLGDGKDGYVKASEDCRSGLRAKCRDVAGSEPRGRRARKIWKDKISTCVSQGLRNRVVQHQRNFAEKAQILLPSMRSLNVRLDVVLFPSSERHEEERIRLLSLKSGGSFRIAEDAADLPVQSEAAAKDLTETIVVDFVPESGKHLPEGRSRELSVEISVPGADDSEIDINTQWAHYKVPEQDHSFSGKLGSIKSWLDGKVGKTASRWIIIFFALILVFIGFKILKKLFKKIFGLFKKAKGGA